jgi:hypothetical protein
MGGNGAITMVYDMFRIPALSGEHGIGYYAVDLAADLGLVTAAGRSVLWAEAGRISRERVTVGLPARRERSSR